MYSDDGSFPPKEDLICYGASYLRSHFSALVFRLKPNTDVNLIWIVQLHVTYTTVFCCFL